jgi:hypothetical protein
VINWFCKRGISNNTLLRLQITEATEWMPGLNKEVPAFALIITVEKTW